MKDEGFMPGAWPNFFILHPSCFILVRAVPLAARPNPLACPITFPLADRSLR